MSSLYRLELSGVSDEYNIFLKAALPRLAATAMFKVDVLHSSEKGHFRASKHLHFQAFVQRNKEQRKLQSQQGYCNPVGTVREEQWRLQKWA